MKTLMDTTAPTAPLLLTAADAAKALAISPRKLWELTNRRIIPVVRIDRSVRYAVEDLRKFIQKQKRA